MTKLDRARDMLKTVAAIQDGLARLDRDFDEFGFHWANEQYYLEQMNEHLATIRDGVKAHLAELEGE